MPLMPKRVKYRKTQRGSRCGNASRNISIAFGEYALQTLDRVTKRPPETRMGKGKGNPEFWVATVRPGNILFELDGVTESVARESLRLAATKLPVKTRFISRQRAIVT
jgi:large subunit ribosomal protein L16